MTGGISRVRARAREQRSVKRGQHLADQEERERLAGLFDSWFSPRGRMVLLAVLILFLAGAVAATTWCAVLFKSDSASAQALQNATVCNPASAARTECRQDISVVVNRTWSESEGKFGSNYFVALSGPAPADGTIQLTAAYWMPAGPDDGAVALVWRGQVVAVLDGTGDQYDAVSAPRLAADKDLNWLVAAALWALALLAVPLSLFTRLRRSIWRHALTFPSVLAAVSFSFGAAGASQPGSGLHVGLYIGAGFFVFFAIIAALVIRNQYRNGDLW